MVVNIVPTYIYIVFRLYKRVTKPIYPPKPKKDDDYLLERWQMEVDAITWKTAHNDINYWKNKGNTGYKKLWFVIMRTTLLKIIIKILK